VVFIGLDRSDDDVDRVRCISSTVAGLVLIVDQRLGAQLRRLAGLQQGAASRNLPAASGGRVGNVIGRATSLPESSRRTAVRFQISVAGGGAELFLVMSGG
jgi:hypothetical protein